MNKIIVLIFIFVIPKAFSQVADSLQVIKIPAAYADHSGEPLIVKKDSLYRFETADIFLVNKKSFLAIKNVYQSTIDQDRMTKELVEKYTQTLRRNMDLERRLGFNFAKTDSLDLLVYQKTQNTLDHTQKALEYTINSLDKASTSLELVEKAAKRQRRKSVFEKILIGIAGVGAGVLIGVSL